MNTDNIKKAIRAEQDGRYAARVVAIKKAFVQEAVSHDENKFEVLKTVVWNVLFFSVPKKIA